MRGYSYFRLGRLDEALGDFLKAKTALSPDGALSASDPLLAFDAHMMIASVHNKKKDHHNALSVYEFLFMQIQTGLNFGSSQNFPSNKLKDFYRSYAATLGYVFSDGFLKHGIETWTSERNDCANLSFLLGVQGDDIGNTLRKIERLASLVDEEYLSSVKSTNKLLNRAYSLKVKDCQAWEKQERERIRKGAREANERHQRLEELEGQIKLRSPPPN